MEMAVVLIQALKLTDEPVSRLWIQLDVELAWRSISI
jgi:hypothetical protein